MSIFYSFLEDATTSLVAGVRTYERQLASAPEKRSARDLPGAIVDIHTSVDKALRHTISEVNPALLLISPSASALQELYKLVSVSKAPTLFALKRFIDTHSLVAAANIARQLKQPTIDQDLWTQFIDACEELKNLRNLSLHGELFGESDQLLGSLTQVLVRYRKIMALLCPRVLERAFAEDDQLESRLKGIENEVETSWQVLLDYIRGGKSITLESSVHVDLFREGELELLLAGGAIFASSVGGTIGLPPKQATGLFATHLEPTEGRFWRARAVPPDPMLGTREFLEAALLAAMDRSNRIGERGVVPSSDGTLVASRFLGWSMLTLADKKRKALRSTSTLLT